MAALIIARLRARDRAMISSMDTGELEAAGRAVLAAHKRGWKVLLDLVDKIYQGAHRPDPTE